MKPKAKKKKVLKWLTEEQVLQISNDISEDMCTASRGELIEVVKYFQAQLDKTIQKHRASCTSTAIMFLKLADNMLKTDEEFKATKTTKAVPHRQS